MTIKHEVGPFAIVPLWVMDALCEAGEPEALRLYVQLHRWTKSDHTCYPSRGTIAEACKVTTKTVDRYIAALVNVGALRVEHREGENGSPSTNLYTVVVVDPRGADVATPTRGRPDRGDTDVATPATQMSHKPDPPEPDKIPSSGSSASCGSARTSTRPDERAALATALAKIYWEHVKTTTGKSPKGVRFPALAKLLEPFVDEWDETAIQSALMSMRRDCRPITRQVLEEYLDGRRVARDAPRQRESTTDMLRRRLAEQKGRQLQAVR